MKVCKECNIEKPIEEFHRNKRMASGRLNKCAECSKKQMKTRWAEKSKDPDFREKERERSRLKQYTMAYSTEVIKNGLTKRQLDTIKYNKENPERHKISKKKSLQRYPEKYKAYLYCRPRLNEKRPPGIEYHHMSYREDFWLTVIPLTRADHKKLHRFLKYDKETFFYRTMDGVLLDTIEKHTDYMKKVLST